MKKQNLFVCGFLACAFAAPLAHAQTTTSTSYQATTNATGQYNDIPTYGYNPKMDPANAPYKTPIAHDPPPGGVSDIDIGTLKTNIEIGGHVSYGDFEAHSGDSGISAGGSISTTQVTQSHWFASAQASIDYGFYNTSSDAFSIDVHGVVGHDFIFGNSYDISPELGLGYTSLYGGSRNFLYIPLGVTQNFRIDHTSRISINTDVDLALTDDTGYGLHVNALYEIPSWSFGPQIQYWNFSSQSNDDSYSLEFLAKYRF